MSLVFRRKWLRWCIPVVVMLANLIIIVLGAAQNTRWAASEKAEADIAEVCGSQPKQGSIVPRWLWPAVVLPIFGLGALYWVVLRLIISRPTASAEGGAAGASKIGLHVHMYETPWREPRYEPPRSPTVWRRLRANPATTDWPADLALARNEAVLDGTRRRMEVKASTIFVRGEAIS